MEKQEEEEGAGQAGAGCKIFSLSHTLRTDTASLIPTVLVPTSML